MADDDEDWADFLDASAYTQQNTDLHVTVAAGAHSTPVPSEQEALLDNSPFITISAEPNESFSRFDVTSVHVNDNNTGLPTYSSNPSPTAMEDLVENFASQGTEFNRTSAKNESDITIEISAQNFPLQGLTVFDGISSQNITMTKESESYETVSKESIIASSTILESKASFEEISEESSDAKSLVVEPIVSREAVATGQGNPLLTTDESTDGQQVSHAVEYDDNPVGEHLDSFPEGPSNSEANYKIDLPHSEIEKEEFFHSTANELEIVTGDLLPLTHPASHSLTITDDPASQDGTHSVVSPKVLLPSEAALVTVSEAPLLVIEDEGFQLPSPTNAMTKNDSPSDGEQQAAEPLPGPGASSLIAHLDQEEAGVANAAAEEADRDDDDLIALNEAVEVASEGGSQQLLGDTEDRRKECGESAIELGTITSPADEAHFVDTVCFPTFHAIHFHP